jgi:hypothetical protein
MSGTLDLNGATTTLTANSINTYYQVTDTSGSHNGKLILEEGAVLRFDNRTGAGFTSVATAIEIYLNGTETNNCAIISADPAPTYLWAMPASTTYIDATYTEFLNYAGNIQGSYWAFNSCLFGGMRYATVEDLQAITGSTNERLVLGRVIENTTQEVFQYLNKAGVSGSGNVIKAATLKLATADLMTRWRMDGSKPQSLTIGVISMKDDNDGAIANLRQEAWELLHRYVMSTSQFSRYRWRIRRGNK